jgi:N-acetylglucosamine-6-phosphate deacetylase
VLTPQGFVRGQLRVAAGRIAAIEGEAIPADQAGAGGRPRILPGFIDLHVHGGGGHDVMEGGEAPQQVAAAHVRHGTTAILATTMTAPLEEIHKALAAVSRAMERPAAPGRPAARILGVHLEGPYLNRGRLGAQPDFVRELALAEIDELAGLAPLRVITLAPEQAGAMALIAPLLARGMRVQLGHSQADYECACAALAAGASGFTHLFNAMGPLHHRAPGLAGAALAHAQHAEIIPDLLHVHPGALRLALRAIPGLYCVTDSTAAAGMPDGEYALGRQRVTKCMGGVRLADGTLAGSTLTMDQALRNLVKLGLELPEAARRVSTHAAQYLGLDDCGQLTVGCRADLVSLDAKLDLSGVWVAGVAAPAA